MYSVIIPSIGRINYINELLDSIYNQNTLPEEIIIIFDDNELCRNGSNQIKKRNNCIIIFTENFNLPQKRNYGALVAKTKYLIFSDDDDIWECDKGEKTIKALEKNKVVSHAFSKFGSYSAKPNFLLGKKKIIVPIIFLILSSNIFGGGSAIAVWREVVIAIPFNKDFSYCEDYEWWIRVFLADIKVIYLPNSLVKYRVHNRNMTTNFLKIYSNNIRIYFKLFLKSIILFITFINGLFRTSLGIMIKIIRYLVNFLKVKLID